MAEQPALVTTITPVAEVGFIDGFAAKMGGQHGLHGGQGVQPGEDGPGGGAIEEELIDLLMEVPGQPSDFSVRFSHNLNTPPGEIKPPAKIS